MSVPILDAKTRRRFCKPGGYDCCQCCGVDFDVPGRVFCSDNCRDAWWAIPPVPSLSVGHTCPLRPGSNVIPFPPRRNGGSAT